MFENPRRGRQARNFATNAPKILDLKSSPEKIFSRKLPLGALVMATSAEIYKMHFQFFRVTRSVCVYSTAERSLLADALGPITKLIRRFFSSQT